MIFNAMTKGYENFTVGFGIGLQEHYDLNHAVYVVNIKDQTVHREEDNLQTVVPVSFDQFISQDMGR